MPNSAQYSFQEQDLTYAPISETDLIAVVLLETTRGKIGIDPDLIVNTSNDLKRSYGTGTSEDMLLAQRALDGGAKLRINRIVHYTTITSKTGYAATKAAVNATNGAMTATVTGTATAGNYVMAATGFTSATVPFNTDHATTLKDAINKFYSVNTDKLLAFSLYPGSITKFYGAPKIGYTLASLGYTGTGISATTVVQQTTFNNLNAEELFRILPIAEGAGYNPLVVSIEAPSNSATGYFNLRLWIQGEEDETESYENLKIEGKVTAGNQHFLDDISNNSFLAQPMYLDLSTIANAVIPEYGMRVYSTGSDGGATTDADYIGDSSGKTGFYAADQVDDAYMISAPAKTSANIHVAGDFYARNRQDIAYMAHLSNSLTNEAALVSARNATGIDSTYTGFYAGGLRVYDPNTASPRNISELADIIAIAARSFNASSPAKSFAGSNRGLLQSVLGVVNNFGATGNAAGMKQLANANINTVIVRNKKRMLWGNFTAQLSTSIRSFMSTRMGLIYIKKTLGPYLESALEENNNIAEWKKVYLACQPFMNSLSDQGILQGQEGIGWTWQGDQFAKDINSLVINKTSDVDQGKYKIKLFMKWTAPLQDITMWLVLSPSGISFEDALVLTND